VPYEQALLDKIGGSPVVKWEGEVFRHMLGDWPPERENVRGARWNPPQVAAIYASLERDVALAEAQYYIDLQPVPPQSRRVLYRVSVRLSKVVDLRKLDELRRYGISAADLGTLEHQKCQPVGGAIAHLGFDGLLVPSARAKGANLVIYPSGQDASYRFEKVDYEVIAPSSL